MSASSRTTYAAFISHAKSDEKVAKEIAAGLEERNFKCWIAPRDVRPGHAYGDEIVRGIEKSRAFILVLSKASNGSAFVAREVERAVSKGKAVYAIRVENVQPSPSLELFISGTQWIDAWSGGLTQHLDGLASLLRKRKGAQPAPPASEPEPQPVPAPAARKRPAWLIGGSALTAAAAIAVAVFVFGPFNKGGPAGSLANDPDYLACAKMSGDAAIAFCDRAIASGKFTGRELAITHVNRAVERGTKGDKTGELEDYNAAIEADPTYALAYYNRGGTYRRAGNQDLALSDVNESIRLEPTADAYNRRGLILKDKGDIESALKDFDAAVGMDGSHIYALTNRADAYRRTGKSDLALADYKKGLSLNPDDESKQTIVAALSELGVSTGDKDNDPDYQGCEKLSGAAAIASCDRAIASGIFGGAELSELYRLRGWERRQKNDLEGGMADYDKAVEVGPTNSYAFYHRGAAYYAENKFDLAIQDFDEALRLKPNYANAFLRRGKAYQAKGDTDSAKQDYENALASNPDDSTKQEIETALKALAEQSGTASQSSAAPN
jgi:tetratricopeptide (TPR) repeat protein